MHAERAGQLRAEQQRTAVQIEGTGDDIGVEHGDIGFVFGIDSAHPRRGGARAAQFRLGLDHHLAEDRRGNSADAAIGADGANQSGIIGNAGIVFQDFEMGVEAENFVAKLFVKAAHDANHDDQNGDAEHHADHRNQCDD